jgi:hypothetical protein
MGSKSKTDVMEKTNSGQYDRFKLSGIPCEFLYDKKALTTHCREPRGLVWE